MAEPIAAQKAPYAVAVEAGKQYWWGRCRRSQKQPIREGSGRDVTDRRYEMAFAGLDSSCSYDKTGVTVDITVQIQATQGLANRETRAKSQYFAAVIDPTGQIVQKEPFDADAEFKDKR